MNYLLRKFDDKILVLGTSLIAILFGLVLFATYNSLFLADGYIFLQYAKNIATGNGWVFNPGEISFGTSSVIWTLALVPLYKLFSQDEQFVRAAVFLGLVFYCLHLYYFFNILQVFGKDKFIVRTLFLVYALFPFNGFFTAMSVMETGLYLFLFFFIINNLTKNNNSTLPNLFLGTLIALLFLTRVEGIFLLIAVCIVNILRKKIRITFLVMVGFVLASIPWFSFIYIHSGRFIPTSGGGRLWGYLSSTLPSLSLNDYVLSSIFQKIAFIPEVISTQFINHPVVLFSCLVPYLFILAAYFYILVSKRGNANEFQITTILTTYCTFNLFAYLIFQPLIFQRYLVTFLPVAVIFSLIVIPSKIATPAKFKLSLISVGLVFVIASNIVGVRYYQIGAQLNQAVISLFQELDRTTQDPCRISAEPLGIAGYFTKCYVIDQGGLINPEIWDVWLDHGGSFGGNIEYSIAQKADYLVLPSTSLPPEYKNQFQLVVLQQELGWAAFEKGSDVP